MKGIFGFLILILIEQTYAQTLSEFCFNSSIEAQKGLSYANQILLGSEKFIYQEGQNFAQIYLKEDRFELVDLFLRRKFRLAASSSSILRRHQIQNGRGHCRLELKEVGSVNEVSKKFQIGARKKIKAYGAKVSNNFQTSIVMMSGGQSEVLTPEGKISVQCTITSRKSARVKIFMNSKLTTQVEINPGQTILLGSFKNQNNSKEKALNLNKGIKASTGKQKINSSYTLRFSSF